MQLYGRRVGCALSLRVYGTRRAPPEGVDEPIMAGADVARELAALRDKVASLELKLDGALASDLRVRLQRLSKLIGRAGHRPRLRRVCSARALPTHSLRSARLVRSPCLPSTRANRSAKASAIGSARGQPSARRLRTRRVSGASAAVCGRRSSRWAPYVPALRPRSPIDDGVSSLYSSRLILTTYPGQVGIEPVPLKWTAASPEERGPVVVSRHPCVDHCRPS